MGRIVAALLLLLPSIVFAESSSQASASGTVVNQALQTNNSTSADLAYSQFSRQAVSCESGSFGIALIPSFSNTDYSDSNNFVGMITLSLPTNFNGTVTRCSKQQAALIRLTQMDINDKNVENDLKIIHACRSAHKNGIGLRVEQFPWAAKCDGLSFHSTEPWRKN